MKTVAKTEGGNIVIVVGVDEAIDMGADADFDALPTVKAFTVGDADPVDLDAR